MPHSRNKGREAERQVGLMLERYKLPYLRPQNGRLQDCDFVIDRRFAGEVKRREKLALVQYHRELEAKTPGHLTPIVIWRPSREPWRVSLLADDFFDMAVETR